MELLGSALIGGVLLGLAGALHCATMCGGLASGGAMMFAPRSRLQSLLTLTAMMSGRVFIYAVLGAAIAASAEFTFTMMSLKPGVVPMPWIGAVFLVWIGLSSAGFFPALALPGAGVATFVSGANRLLSPLRGVPYMAPFVTGMIWGLAPCPMVYAALFTAALTGTALAGFVWMLGFGLGTVPAVVLSALGIKALSQINTNGLSKIAAGLAIALFGIATVFLDLPVFSALCIPS